MTERKQKTARELVEELNRDQEYMSRRGAQEDARLLREAGARVNAQPLIEELRSVGLELDDLNEVARRYAPLMPEIVNPMVSYLRLTPDPAVQEQIVRALAVAAEPFDGRTLANLFDHTDSDNLRFAIANTMAEARPSGIDEWLIGALKASGLGLIARQMLPLAAVRILGHARANPVLLGLLDELPGHVALALSESGGIVELRALEARLGNCTGWERTQSARAISVIRRRLKET